MIQVDLVKPAELELSEAVVLDVVRAAECLRRTPHRNRTDSQLRDFCRLFRERYGDRELPLGAILDEDVGLGFPTFHRPVAETAPLLRSLAIDSRDPEANHSFGSFEKWLLDRLLETHRSGGHELEVDVEDLERSVKPPLLPLPDSMCAFVALAARSAEALNQGDYELFLEGIGGAPAVRTFSRFGASDERMRSWIQQELDAEASLYPEAVVAEVVDFAEDRISNIMRCPASRSHEIPILGMSAVPPERQIRLDDLYVSVVDERVVLRSAVLDREVIPRISHAYAFFRNESLNVIRFLGALQNQLCRSPLGWDWGPFSEASFLPRVRFGRVVLAPATWNVTRDSLLECVECPKRLQAFREKTGLPRFVKSSESGTDLPVDLENPLSVDAVLRGTRRSILLKELFPPPEALCVEGPERRFIHEMLIPFRRRAAVRRPGPSAQRVSERRGRSFAPGSEWLSLKIYVGSCTMERILMDRIVPFLRARALDGWFDKWFFLRYSDPQHHLRLRLHGEPTVLSGAALPGLNSLLDPVVSREDVWQIQVDTYKREVERYGGSDAISLVEDLFWHDSECVASVIESTADQVARWHLAIRGVEEWLQSFGLSLDERRELVRRTFQAYSTEFGADAALRKRIGKIYRERRSALIGCFEASGADEVWGAGVRAFAERAERSAVATDRLRELDRQGRLSTSLRGISTSVAHMFLNRLLLGEQRRQELVIYDLLDRLHTLCARTGRNGLQAKVLAGSA